jgi:hypothetical protein
VTGGQLVVDTLRALGVDRVFGVPGGQTLAIMDAIFDSPDIEFTATRHEGAAACMADAVGRLTRQPGVCLATTGPGATNLLTGVGGAMRDSSPVLVLTCNNRMAEMGRDDAQNADHVAIFRPMTKWTTLVLDPLTIPRVLQEAAIRATSGCPGPVLVDFARNALEASVPLAAAKEVGYGAGAGSQASARSRPRPQAAPRPGRRGGRAPASRAETRAWIGNGAQLSGRVVGRARPRRAPVGAGHHDVQRARRRPVGPSERLRAAQSHGDPAQPAGRPGERPRGRDRQQPERRLDQPVEARASRHDRPDRPRRRQPRGQLSDADSGDRRRRPHRGGAAEDGGRRSAGGAASTARADRLAELARLKAKWWAEVDEVDMLGAPMSPPALIKALRQETSGRGPPGRRRGQSRGLVAPLAYGGPTGT